jgi:Bacterial mobilisation protein (MobC).
MQCRVSRQTKVRFAELSQRRGLSESAALRRLIESTLEAAGLTAVDVIVDPPSPSRAARIMVRLAPDDKHLLRERSAARGMPAATYISVLVRSHLHQLPPLTTAELAALKRVVSELGSIGRNLNQLAKAANQGRVTGPSRDDLRALLRACEGLRTHVNSLLEVNLASWNLGHDSKSR